MHSIKVCWLANASPADVIAYPALAACRPITHWAEHPAFQTAQNSWSRPMSPQHILHQRDADLDTTRQTFLFAPPTSRMNERLAQLCASTTRSPRLCLLHLQAVRFGPSVHKSWIRELFIFRPFNVRPIINPCCALTPSPIPAPRTNHNREFVLAPNLKARPIATLATSGGDGAWYQGSARVGYRPDIERPETE